MSGPTRALCALTLLLLGLSTLLFVVAPWIEGPNSMRTGGSASVLFVAGIVTGAAWAVRAGARL